MREKKGQKCDRKWERDVRSGNRGPWIIIIGKGDIVEVCECERRGGGGGEQQMERNVRE